MTFFETSHNMILACDISLFIVFFVPSGPAGSQTVFEVPGLQKWERVLAIGGLAVS